MKTIEHPEIIEIKHICKISGHAPSTENVCNNIANDQKDRLKNKAIRKKENKKLDLALKETFPASDAIADYR